MVHFITTVEKSNMKDNVNILLSYDEMEKNSSG